VSSKRLQPNYTETIQQVIKLAMQSGVDVDTTDRLNISNYNLTDF